MGESCRSDVWSEAEEGAGTGPEENELGEEEKKGKSDGRSARLVTFLSVSVDTAIPCDKREHER